MSVAEIDLTGLEGPDADAPDGAREAPAAGTRRSLTGLAPRRAPAVSRLRREARTAGPESEEQRGAGRDAARPDGSGRPAADPDQRGAVVPGPDQGGRPAVPPRPDQGGRAPADPRTGAPVQGRGAPAQPRGQGLVQGRSPQQGPPSARGPVVRRPPPGYRPQVPVRQRPAAPPPRGREGSGPAHPAGAPMAPAAQAALAQAAAARAAMAATQTAGPPEPSPPLDDTLPRYLQLVRKEARVRSDQAEWMAMEVRRINSSRRRRDGVVGERITDNTLIRVALDLLRARGADLGGTTEDELVRSVLRHDPD